MRQRSTFPIASITLVVFVAMGICDLHAQTAHDATGLKEAKPRLQAIYERGEFRPQRFRAEWLPDSSGYTIRERDPKTNKPIVTSYDVRTGERTESNLTEGKNTDPGRFLSPDGKRVLEFRNRHLFVRDLESGQRTQLTKRVADRDISYRDPVWSPDGNRIAFVEPDVDH